MSTNKTQEEQVEHLKENLKRLGKAMIACSMVALVLIIKLLIERINDGKVLFPWMDDVYIPTDYHSIDGILLVMLISVVVMIFEGVNLLASKRPKRVWIPITTILALFVYAYVEAFPYILGESLYYLIVPFGNLGFDVTLFLIYFDFLFRYRLHKAESES